MTKKENKSSEPNSSKEDLNKFKQNLNSELDQIFDEKIIQAKKGTGKDKKTKQIANVQLNNFGAVRTFVLPANWIESNLGKETEQQRSRIFQHKNNSAIQLCFFLRSHPASKLAAAEFLKLLEKSDHFLAPSEFKLVLEIVRELGNPATFKLLQVSTKQISGKRVMIIEGRFMQGQQDTYTIFIDTDGTGANIQEIHFQAPKLEYARYLFEIKIAMDSLQWQ